MAALQLQTHKGIPLRYSICKKKKKVSDIRGIYIIILRVVHLGVVWFIISFTNLIISNGRGLIFFVVGFLSFHHLVNRKIIFLLSVMMNHDVQ